MAGYLRVFLETAVKAGYLPIKRLSSDGDPLCNMYLFSSLTPDYFELDTPITTEDFKFMFAGTSETGIPAQIVAGRQGAFVPSTDPINDPQWNQYHLPIATGLSVLVEATATGRISYALDDVKYQIDNPQDYRWYTRLNGVNSYFELDDPYTTEVGTPITLEFTGFSDVEVYSRFFASDDFALSVDTNADGKSWRFAGCTITVDGVIKSIGDLIPEDSEHHTLVATPTVVRTIFDIGRVSNTAGRVISAIIFNAQLGSKHLPLSAQYTPSLDYDGAQGYNIQEADVTRGKV